MNFYNFCFFKDFIILEWARMQVGRENLKQTPPEVGAQQGARSHDCEIICGETFKELPKSLVTWIFKNFAKFNVKLNSLNYLDHFQIR